MVSPQLEKGHTRIANELLEALVKYVANPTWLRVAFVVVRITYGWRRKETGSDVKFFADSLGLTEAHIKAVLDKMASAKIIAIQWKRPRKFKIKLNKNYEEWKCYKKPRIRGK